MDVEPRREVEQLEVPREAITFVDERGADVKEPSPNLEVQLVFEWPEEQVTLREFGLFGGDATAQAGSGVMINHVVHERIDLQPRQRLTRELRLLARAVGGGRAALAQAPPHWIADADAHVIGGVGPRIAGVLADKGIETVDALANVDPQAGAGLPRVPLIELRTSPAGPPHRGRGDPAAGARRRDGLEGALGASSDIAHDTGVAETQVVTLREQLSTLRAGARPPVPGAHDGGRARGSRR